MSLNELLGLIGDMRAIDVIMIVLTVVALVQSFKKK